MDCVRCESASGPRGRGLPRPCALEDGAYCPLLTSTGSPPPLGDAELWNSRCQPAEASALGPWPSRLHRERHLPPRSHPSVTVFCPQRTGEH